MAAFVVAPPPETGLPRVGTRLDIFPGSATPSVFAAGVPFWIGYGFVPDPGETAGGVTGLDTATRFELDVDGDPVTVQDVTAREGNAVSKRCVANFESGLRPGWHRFVGRWYDAGALVLTSDRSIEFVE